MVHHLTGCIVFLAWLPPKTNGFKEGKDHVATSLLNRNPLSVRPSVRPIHSTFCTFAARAAAAAIATNAADCQAAIIVAVTHRKSTVRPSVASPFTLLREGVGTRDWNLTLETESAMRATSATT